MACTEPVEVVYAERSRSKTNLSRSEPCSTLILLRAEGSQPSGENGRKAKVLRPKSEESRDLLGLGYLLLG